MRKVKTRSERPSCLFQNRGSELEIIHGAHSIPQKNPQPNKTLRNPWCCLIYPFPLLPSVSPPPPPLLCTHASVSVFSIKGGNASCLPERQDGSVALQSIRQLGLHGRAGPAESHFDLLHLLLWKVLDPHKLLIACCSRAPAQLQELQAGNGSLSPPAPGTAGRRAPRLLWNDAFLGRNRTPPAARFVLASLFDVTFVLEAGSALLSCSILFLPPESFLASAPGKDPS